MTNPLSTLLETKTIVLADGAMGTGLIELGVESQAAPEMWNLAHPEQVQSVHRAFVEAGADIVLTNTFGGNRLRLAPHGLGDRVAEVNVAATRLVREAVAAAGRPALVAGSIGPTGKMLRPYGDLDREDAERIFAEQAAALAEGGVDLIWTETFSATEELEAALSGVAPTGLPVVATMTFDTNGCTMMGVTPEAAITHVRTLPSPPAAFGANCGVGPASLVDSILGLVGGAGAHDVIVAKGNCGVPQYHDGSVDYDGTPEIMADYACLARDAGARIIGGCCGTTAAHLGAMAEALARRPQGAAPDRAAIERQLGPVAKPSQSAGAHRTRARGRRRRSV
jgi:5-methyltetrahydrofolate--homocysteine methyltransferase